jgi:hypothetical protein
MNKIASTLASLVALGCGGAAQSHDEASLPAQKSMSAKESMAACERSCSPKLEAPVEIAYRDAAGGASVVFTTRGDPGALRECVSEVARSHDSATPSAVQDDLYAVPHTARVQDVQGGIMLTLIASAQNDYDQLRNDVQQDVWAMQHGCAGGHELL